MSCVWAWASRMGMGIRGWRVACGGEDEAEETQKFHSISGSQLGASDHLLDTFGNV